MQTKKNPEAAIERNKLGLFALGLTFALTVTLCSFEFVFNEGEAGDMAETQIDLLEEEEIMEAPVNVTPPPPPPPPPTITQIEIVDDEEDVPEPDLSQDEIDEDFEVEEPIMEEPEEEIVEEEIFTIVEESPTFPGGEARMMEFLKNNVKYPQMAKDAGISGKVYVNFIVDKDGSITNVNVKRGIGGGCDKEAIRVIKSMPNWKPGKQRGKPVKVSFTMPINFILR